MSASLSALVHERLTALAHQPALQSVDGHALTYSTLCHQMGEIASALRVAGIHRHDRVAVAMPAGPEMAALFLSIASAATCAPLNPAYKRSDFDFYLNDLNPKAVVLPAGSLSPLAAAAQDRGIPILAIETLPPESNRICRIVGSADPTVCTMDWAEPDDVALILHTSGTTSRPKMVPLSHTNLCTSARNIARTLCLTPEDRCLNVMPLFHIHGLVGGLLSSLAAGSSVICAPGYHSGHFLEWARTYQASWYTAVPTIHQSVLEQAAAEPEKGDTIRFRFIRSSSAALPPSMLGAMESWWGAPVIESYGMSEAAHQMTSNPLPPAARKPGSVGIPAGPEVAVMTEEGNLLPPGQRGEIVIRGPSVMPGYEQNPDANARGFTDGWMRTGDEGYFDEDGHLFLTGRLEEMINRGGESIAPREVDEALLAHPAVAQAAAFAVPHATLGEDLAAAVVLRPGHAPDEQTLRRFLATRLADFKVPSRILAVGAIPNGATGKVQRIGLHERLATLLRTDYAPPVTEEERWVADAFGTVLGHERVGRGDNFFALGGDSLRAIRAAHCLEAHVHQEFPVALVFECPTPALLGVELKRLREQASELDALARAFADLSPEEAARLLSGEAGS